MELTIDTAAFLQTAKHSFSTPTTYITELCQNYRRAGAKAIDIVYHEEMNSLTFLARTETPVDYEALFTLGLSGWPTELQQKEQPFGMGFLSALFACEAISITSPTGRLPVIETRDILAGAAFDILPADTDDTIFALYNLQDPPTLTLIQELFCGFPIPITFNGVTIIRSHHYESTFPIPHVGWTAPMTDVEFISMMIFDYRFYLQGLPINNTYVTSRHVAIHLDDPTLDLTPRMPDRAQFTNPKTVSEINKRIQEHQVTLLRKYIAEHSPDDIASNVFTTLRRFSTTLTQEYSNLTAIPGDCVYNAKTMPTAEMLPYDDIPDMFISESLSGFQTLRFNPDDPVYLVQDSVIADHESWDSNILIAYVVNHPSLMFTNLTNIPKCFRPPESIFPDDWAEYEYEYGYEYRDRLESFTATINGTDTEVRIVKDLRITYKDNSVPARHCFDGDTLLIDDSFDLPYNAEEVVRSVDAHIDWEVEGVDHQAVNQSVDNLVNEYRLATTGDMADYIKRAIRDSWLLEMVKVPAGAEVILSFGDKGELTDVTIKK